MALIRARDQTFELHLWHMNFSSLEWMSVPH